HRASPAACRGDQRKDRERGTLSGDFQLRRRGMRRRAAALLVGGASVNDNAAAALLMGGLVALAAERRIGIMVAHHASKGRDPNSAESAMGAASFVNLARIALGIEPLAEKDAPQVGLPSWEAGSVFRIVGTKQNLRPPDEADRWFRLKSVQMQNAQPPVYPTGD